MSIKDFFEEIDGQAMTMDGYDDCIAGVVQRFGCPMIVCYDKIKVIQKMMSQGMTEDEADEFFEFNQLGAWVGDTTPCFIILGDCTISPVSLHATSDGVCDNPGIAATAREGTAPKPVQVNAVNHHQ